MHEIYYYLVKTKKINSTPGVLLSLDSCCALYNSSFPIATQMEMETVPFEIAHCSSFEQDYEPEQLLISGPSTNQDPFQNVNHRGWQTQK